MAVRRVAIQRHCLVDTAIAIDRHAVIIKTSVAAFCKVACEVGVRVVQVEIEVPRG